MIDHQEKENSLTPRYDRTNHHEKNNYLTPRSSSTDNFKKEHSLTPRYERSGQVNAHTIKPRSTKYKLAKEHTLTP